MQHYPCLGSILLFQLNVCRGACLHYHAFRPETGTLKNASEYRTMVYEKISGLAALSENCKWYSSLPLGVVVSLLCESV
jgi:threonine/homoserine efflux transporter RhtA